jgi:hypothetical protein
VVAVAQPWRDAALVAAAKVGVSALVLGSGFRAISDDDYARVVIAQRFAAAPALDPSGTSWLPLPFWIHGLVMAIAGRTLEVARATSLLLGVIAAVLVYVAARWLAVPRPGALAGGLIACAIPYAAWLGVATVPDGPTAALILLGAASASSTDLKTRAAGGLSLLAAALCRYEAWPVAAAFAALTAYDAYCCRSRALVAAAVMPLAGPVGWMIHGAVNHGSPLFFVARVAAYRRALGASPASLLSGLTDYPLRLVRCEPELVGLSAVAVAAAWLLRRPLPLGRYRRLWLLLGALLVFLVAGDLRDTAPTHHPERALLALWLGMAILVGDLLVQAWRAARPGQRWVALAAVAVLIAATGVSRASCGCRDGFVDRSAEVAIGRAAQALAPTRKGRLLVDTEDFGFFAVVAGFAQPERAAPFDPRDPRQPPRDDAFAATRALRERLHAERASWFVATQPHASVARTCGRVLAENARLVLLEVKPCWTARR